MPYLLFYFPLTTLDSQDNGILPDGLKGTEVGGRVSGGVGVVAGTHPVCAALTMDPSGHVEQEKEIKPEYVPGGHFLHP